MNRMRALAAFITLLAAGAAVISCGGGNVASGGTGGTGMVARGSVSQIGSIFVNGVEYDTTGATIHIPGQPDFIDTTGTVGGADILVGMLVTVRGTINADGVTGQADSVTYSRGLVGQVSSFTASASGSTFSIYGQTVVVDDLTSFLPVGGWLADNQWVEVSGFVLDGEVRATFIKQLDAAPGSVEIEGTVVATDAIARTINVGGTLVHVPAAFDLTPVVVGSTYVEVVAAPPVSSSDTVLTATSVTVEDTSLAAEAGEEAEIEGLITHLAPDGASFVVAGQRVLLGAGTEFQGGVSTDLAVGVKVEVEGAINAAGALVAGEVDFKDSIEVGAIVASVDAATDAFTYELGIPVQLDPNLTEGYAAVVAGEAWRVRGRQVGGVILATSMERGDSAEVELQGPVSSFTAPTSLTILGVPVAGLSEFSANDATVTRTRFFNLLNVNDLVEVKGSRIDAANVDWVSAELE